MRIRTINALPLDDDTVDRVLTFLSSFIDLRSAILSSQAFYTVFNARPSSIVEAVAYNEVGPALPQALMVLRYKTKDPWPEGASLSPISCREAQFLSKNTAVVKALEDLFSSRHVQTLETNSLTVIYALLDTRSVPARRASSTSWSLGAFIGQCIH
jgi:hypothetical protein